MSEVQRMIYRPVLQKLQARRKKLKQWPILETERSITVKTKNTFKYKNCIRFPKFSKRRPFS